MKLYDFNPAPNPRRVRIFAAEKGIALEIVPVDLRDGGQFEDSFRAVNPRCAVPVLQLDDGTRITESVAICRYLEDRRGYYTPEQVAELFAVVVAEDAVDATATEALRARRRHELAAQ